MPELRLHLGLRKTGTTFLQRWLDVSKFAPNTNWINEKAARKQIRIRAPLPTWLESDDTVIVSDENLLSHCDNRQSFSHPTDRLSCLIPDQPALFIGLRNYADFFTSSWVQLIKRQKYRPFFPNEPLTRRWPDLLRDLTVMFPNSPITVWNYADFRGNEAQIAQLITGNRVAELGPRPRDKMNQRLSTSAIDTLSKLEQPPKDAAYHKFFAAHPITASNPKFDPWTPETRAPLDDAFVKDWDEIAKYGTIWRPT